MLRFLWGAEIDRAHAGCCTFVGAAVAVADGSGFGWFVAAEGSDGWVFPADWSEGQGFAD